MTIKRKIDAKEEPYVPVSTGDEGDGEPPYLDEWLDADQINSMLGLCTLGLLENALHKYLQKFAMREPGIGRDEDFSTPFKQFKGQGCLNKHFWFLEERRFDWGASPVCRVRLEQISRTRNDITHFPALYTTTPTRTTEHIKKHPVSMFADETEVLMLAGSDELPVNIKVTGENLMAAIENVRRFCGFVETRRTVW